MNAPEELKEKTWSRLSSKIDSKKFKLVEKQNLHITLNFLGYLGEEKLKEVEEKLQTLKEFKKFGVVLGKAECFKDRVILLKIENGRNEIVEMIARIRELLELQEAVEPHFTLARKRDAGREEIRKLLEELNRENFRECFQAESIELMKSVLTQKGPIYSIIKKIKLG